LSVFPFPNTIAQKKDGPAMACGIGRAWDGSDEIHENDVFMSTAGHVSRAMLSRDGQSSANTFAIRAQCNYTY
jgi:hypothetical protein